MSGEISHYTFCESRLKNRIGYHHQEAVVGEMITYDNGVYFLEGQMDMDMDMDISELGGGVKVEPPTLMNSPRASAGSGTMSTDSSEDPVGGNSDDEESNLSWLLNFKVDSLFCLDNHDQAPLGHQHTLKRQYPLDDHDQSKMEGAHRYRTQETANYLQSIVQQSQNRGFLAEANGASNNHGYSQNQTKRSKHDQSVKDLINFGALLSPNKKPPFTYTELIEQALTEKGELTVSGIYKWISDHFSYYKSDDDRWKNSVRHNLSINPLFCKGVKAPKGAGHLWTIVNRDDTSFTLRKQQRTKLLCSYISLGEVAAATASIEENKENRTLETLQAIENMDTLETYETDDPLAVCDEPSLEQSAEDILTGIKREVQVQYVQSGQRPNDTDFLNPVAKEVIVEESGLIERLPGELDGSYVIADLDTDGLEFSISETEIITADNLLFDEMNCQLYELSSPVYHLEV